MRSARLILVAALFTFAACADAASSTSRDEQDVAQTRWEMVLTCEGGAVVVDVDAGERRDLQVVVRSSGSFPALDTTISYNQIKNPSERIYRGDSPYGIFDPVSFRHLRAVDYVRNAAGKRPGFEAIREGDTLRLRSLDLARTGCEPQSLDTSPPDDAFPEACEEASYVFHGCS